ncbi:hypothetical protein E5288_WYG000754 [Bos mutus]|uniref:Uncharacterized protein n=1 Tax=Bos mutus TaxID=72004 RepID=A0A6B0RPV4_9CETA|nr:hypothetical protein [Bos mutus]
MSPPKSPVGRQKRESSLFPELFRGENRRTRLVNLGMKYGLDSTEDTAALDRSAVSAKQLGASVLEGLKFYTHGLLLHFKKAMTTLDPLFGHVSHRDTYTNYMPMERWKEIGEKLSYFSFAVVDSGWFQVAAPRSVCFPCDKNFTEKEASNSQLDIIQFHFVTPREATFSPVTSDSDLRNDL